ncbi:protein ImuB [Enterovirga rhinocerotis]|uniref:Protein ImuB n=1 Tax=Enterovirga rhinocerotis TaxID=1339210 RepID=A0A4R7CA42_9HYPH|nr:protein ImuB [Enterovirga rhinocerotis]
MPNLAVRDHEPEEDAAFLVRLAQICDRWTPLVAPAPPDGLILDVTGCAALFGGEERLRDDVLRLFRAGGLTVRAALAGTPEAARSLARHGRVAIVPPGEEGLALRPLPVAALGLAETERIALSRAGLKRIGDLADLPSAALASRFGEEINARLRRLLGREDLRLTPLRPPPPYRMDRLLAEPIGDLTMVEQVLDDLVREAVARLEAEGRGGRVFEADVFRTDGAARRIAVSTGRPSRDAPAILRLLREKLDALADPLDPGFGFDLVRLSIPVVEPLAQAQAGLDGRAVEEDEVSDLVDRLVARFGPRRVLRFVAADSHDPVRASQLRPGSFPPQSLTGQRPPSLRHAEERLEAAPRNTPQQVRACFETHRCATLLSMTQGGRGRSVPSRKERGGAVSGFLQPAPLEPPTRPLQVFDPPQPIETIAELPDGPPLRFRWRRVLHRVVRAEGPERIAAEWWRAPDDPTRDYYRVEDDEGRRFWLYRAGLYGRETDRPLWYVHGLFA